MYLENIYWVLRKLIFKLPKLTSMFKELLNWQPHTSCSRKQVHFSQKTPLYNRHTSFISCLHAISILLSWVSLFQFLRNMFSFYLCLFFILVQILISLIANLTVNYFMFNVNRTVWIKLFLKLNKIYYFEQRHEAII